MRHPAHLYSDVSTCEVATIFIVITGGPSVGKTTIVTLLRNHGYSVVNEQATQIIKEGKILPWEDRDAFQKEVLRRQLEVEEPFVNSTDPVFLDRGMFDGEAYYMLDGLPVPSIFTELTASRYSLALLIEELPFFDNNGVRFEDIEFTRKITPVIEDCYTRRNVATARIPALPPLQRVEHVIQVVKQHMTSASQSNVVPVGSPALVLA